jgi:hypothetical protein
MNTVLAGENNVAGRFSSIDSPLSKKPNLPTNTSSKITNQSKAYLSSLLLCSIALT